MTVQISVHTHEMLLVRIGHTPAPMRRVVPPRAVRFRKVLRPLEIDAYEDDLT